MASARAILFVEDVACRLKYTTEVVRRLIRIRKEQQQEQNLGNQRRVQKNRMNYLGVHVWPPHRSTWQEVIGEYDTLVRVRCISFTNLLFTL